MYTDFEKRGGSDHERKTPEHQLANGGTLEGGQVLAFEVSEQVGGRVNHGAFEILHR